MFDHLCQYVFHINVQHMKSSTFMRAFVNGTFEGSQRALNIGEKTALSQSSDKKKNTV